jgi:hypothetical protein
MKRLAVLLVFVTSLSLAQQNAAPVHGAVRSASAVKHVHRIYVDELHFPGNPDWDGIVRSKLISSLAQNCGSACVVVEDMGANGDNGDDTSDAVLAGSLLVQSPDNRRFRVQGAMRLVDKDGTVVWAATIYSSPFARSATSSFADNTARKLTAFLAGSVDAK